MAPRAGRSATAIRALVWAAVALSVAILVVFTAIRLAQMGREPHPLDHFGLRYLAHPGVALLHILPGLAFVALGPLQFVAGLRARAIAWHRRAGRVLVAAGTLSGAFALAAAFRLPAYGGIVTQSATVLFGAVFLYALARGFVHARRREIAAHREWMLRAFALGLGVATIRVVIALLQAVAGLGFEEVFGAAFWIGLGLNLAAAEAWIRRTRARPRELGSKMGA